jgi:alkyl sulfatase BDS1-like metallo-beta-lactamase superfamily hydrolase
MSSFGKTKAQIAAEILGAERHEYTGDEFNLVFPDTLVLSEKYQYIEDWYKDKKNHNYSRKLNAIVAGVPHVFGYGGIHGAISNCVEEGIILAVDVSSLYPAIIIEYGFMSRAVKDIKKYREIRDKRLQYKKNKDPRQAPLKIVLR